MKSTTEKTWAYMVLTFVIMLLCFGLRDNKNPNAVFSRYASVSEDVAPDTVMQEPTSIYNLAMPLSELALVETGVSTVRIMMLKSHDTKLMKNYIVFACLVAMILFLCQISRIFIGLFNRCSIPIWMVVAYIHNADGEKGMRASIA